LILIAVGAVLALALHVADVRGPSVRQRHDAGGEDPRLLTLSERWVPPDLEKHSGDEQERLIGSAGE
jgi:hypothetical protein